MSKPWTAGDREELLKKWKRERAMWVCTEEKERERVCLTFPALVFCAMRRPGGNRIEEASFPPPAHTSLLNICLGQLCSWLARTNKACRRVKTCQRVAGKHRASRQDRETERDTVGIKLEREREREMEQDKKTAQVMEEQLQGSEASSWWSTHLVSLRGATTTAVKICMSATRCWGNTGAPTKMPECGTQCFLCKSGGTFWQPALSFSPFWNPVEMLHKSTHQIYLQPVVLLLHELGGALRGRLKEAG